MRIVSCKTPITIPYLTLGLLHDLSNPKYVPSTLKYDTIYIYIFANCASIFAGFVYDRFNIGDLLKGKKNVFVSGTLRSELMNVRI